MGTGRDARLERAANAGGRRWLGVLAALALLVPFATAQVARALEPLPVLNVQPDYNAIWTDGWQPESTLILAIRDDDGSGGPGALWQSVTTTADFDGNANVFLEADGPIDFPGRHFVISGTAADGSSVTKAHRVPSLTLEVDTETATATGTTDLPDPDGSFDVAIQAFHESAGRVISPAEAVWSADLTSTGVVGPDDTGGVTAPLVGGYVSVAQLDADGDSTEAHLDLPNPRLHINVDTDHVAVMDFAEGTTVSIELVRNGASQGAWGVLPVPQPGGGTGVDLNLFAAGVDVLAGDVLTATQGTLQKVHTVTAASFTAVDASIPTATFVVDPAEGMNLTVQGFGTNGSSAQRDYNADELTLPHTVDLTVSDSAAVYEHGQVDPPLAWVWLDQWDIDGDSTVAQWGEADGGGFDGPTFTVEEPYDVWSSSEAGLAEGDIVEVYVNPTGDRSDFDHHQSAIVVVGEWGLQIDLHTAPFEIMPGDRVVVDYTDGSSKSLVVEPLSVDEADAAADRVAGTALPGATVEVDVGDEFTGAHRTVEADAYGAWVADFAVDAGEGPFDVTEDMGGSAQVFDGDGDSVHRGICFGDCGGGGGGGGDTQFVASVNNQSVEAHDWPDGRFVELSIDDPGTPEAPDYTAGAPVGENPAGRDGNVGFSLRDQFDLEAGHVVTLTDGDLTLSHVVQTIEVTAVDEVNDLVRGTADPGDEIWVFTTNQPELAARLLTVGPDGTWTADLGTPGPGPQDTGTVDLAPGVQGGAIEPDPINGNETEWVWRVPDPRITVDHLENWVEGQEWGEGTTVTVTVDDPTTSPTPDHTLTVEVERHGPSPWDTGFWLDLQQHGIDVRPGDVVAATDGDATKDHTVIDLRTTGDDPAHDHVYGTAPAGTEVLVQGGDEHSGGERLATAGTDGAWTADFSVADPQFGDPVDLTDGMEGRALAMDEDGDGTAAQWRMEPPRIEANQFTDELYLQGFDVGDAFDVRVVTAPLVELVAPVVIEQDGPYYFQTVGRLDVLASGHDLATGSWVGLYDAGGSTLVRELVVSPLTITALDPGAADDGSDQAVRGEADGGAPIILQMRNSTGWAFREASSDPGDGTWVAHVGSHDLTPWGEVGEGVVGDVTDEFDVGMHVAQPDEDGDATVVAFGSGRIGTLWIEPLDDLAYGHFFTGLWPITVTISAADGTVLHTVSDVPVQRDPVGEHLGPLNFTTALGHDLSVGHVVTASDGLYGAQTHVRDMAITEVNLVTETVSGDGLPGDLTIASADGPEVEVVRLQCIRGDGAWSASFGLAFPLPYEPTCAPELVLEDLGGAEEPVDVRHGTVDGGEVSVSDERPPHLFGWLPADDDTMVLTWATHLHDLQATPDVVEVGEDPVTFSARFGGADDRAHHAPVAASVDWGDGTTSAGVLTHVGDVAQPHDVAVEAEHIYAVAGVYRQTLTVTFADGHIEVEDTGFVVAHDDSFVTGGGWFTSPAGALASDPIVGGRATFGFVGKYHDWATWPTGSLEFQLHDADLRLHSVSFDWLLVEAGGRATLRGDGTVNGVPGYEFRLTVTDGDPDAFQIRIWEGATGEVVYDSGAIDPGGTSLGGGSVVVHTKGR